MRPRFDESSVDTTGLFFGLKFLAALVILFTLAYGGGQWVGENVFGSDELAAKAEKDVERAHLHRELISSVREAMKIMSEDDIVPQSNEPVLAIASVVKPATSARTYLVADLMTGQVYIQKQATQQVPIASVTKLMTADIALNYLATSTYVYNRSNGESYRPKDMLYPLLLRSDNLVADSLAEAKGYAVFVKAMNEKAKTLGMLRTRYDDPSGISAANVSTAADLFRLAQYLYFKERPLLELSREPSAAIVAQSGNRLVMTNQNYFSKNRNFIGGKLGFTEAALQTSLGVFSVNIAGSKRTVAVIVLGSHDWKQDTGTLLSWFEDAASPLPQQNKSLTQL